FVLERGDGVLVGARGRCGVDEAKQMGSGSGDEMQTDALPDTGEDGTGANRELVAAVQLGRDQRRLLGRPVALAVEAEPRLERERTSALRQRDPALEVRAPE